MIKWDDCGKGVNVDVMPEELAAGVWSNVKNMRFRRGFAERFRGMKNIFSDTSVTPYFLTYYQSPETRFWIHVGNQHAYADDGFTRNEITPAAGVFTGAIDDKWSGAAFNGYSLISNGVDVPHSWDGDTSNNYTPLTAWDSSWRCKALVSFKQYIIALNVKKGTTQYPSMVKWSSSAEPGTLPTSWDHTDVTKDAGEVDLAETPDDIVDAMQLGDSMIIYKQRSMYLMSFIGQPYIFRFQRLPFEHGLLAKGCVADTPVGHVCLTNGDVVVHSGGSPRSIADGLVRDYIFKNISSSNYQRSFVCTSPQTSEVVIAFPTQGSQTCNKAAVWNWKENTWGFRDLTNVTYGASGLISPDYGIQTWNGDSESWDADISLWNENEYASNEGRLLFSRTNNVSVFDIGNDDFGTDFESYVERTGISFDDAGSVKLLTKVHPKIDATDGASIVIDVGGSMSPSHAPTVQNSATYTVGTDFKADAIANGRFLSIKLKSARDQWRMRSIDFDVKGSGAF